MMAGRGNKSLVPEIYRKRIQGMRRTMGIRRCDIFRTMDTWDDWERLALQNYLSQYDFLHELRNREKSGILFAYAMDVHRDVCQAIEATGARGRKHAAILLWDDDYRSIGHLWPHVGVMPSEAFQKVRQAHVGTGPVCSLVRSMLLRAGMADAFQMSEIMCTDQYMPKGSKAIYIFPSEHAIPGESSGR